MGRRSSKPQLETAPEVATLPISEPEPPKPVSNVTKSSLIREYLKTDADMGPTALAQKLSADYPDKTFTAAEISAMKTKLKGGKAPGGAPGRPAKASGRPSEAYGQVTGIVGYLTSLKHAISGLGKDDVKKLVDVL